MYHNGRARSNDHVPVGGLDRHGRSRRSTNDTADDGAGLPADDLATDGAGGGTTADPGRTTCGHSLALQRVLNRIDIGGNGDALPVDTDVLHREGERAVLGALALGRLERNHLEGDHSAGRNPDVPLRVLYVLGHVGGDDLPRLVMPGVQGVVGSEMNHRTRRDGNGGDYRSRGGRRV